MCSVTTEVHIHTSRCRTAFLGAINNRMMTLHHQQSLLLMNVVVSNAAAVVVHRILRRRQKRQGFSIHKQTFRKRQRGSFLDIYKELGDAYFRRAYRISYNNFKRLGSLLHPDTVLASGKKHGPRNHLHNGSCLKSALHVLYVG